jgi:cell fate (sporulation/competence/biofilm development) regulator YlbF (YheA/YmcA/DUF963 family)
LLDIENETCKIVLSSESIDFCITVIKSFLIKSINDVESINESVQSTFEDVQSSFEDVQSSDQSFAITKSTRARRLSLRYQNFADIIVFLQDEDSHSIQFEDVADIIVFLQDENRIQISLKMFSSQSLLLHLRTRDVKK